MNASATVPWSRIPCCDPVRVGYSVARMGTSGRHRNGLGDDILLRICRVRAGDPNVTPEWISSMRRVVRLLAEPCACQQGHVEASMALLAAALAEMPQYNPTHLPFGYNGPVVRSRDWIQRDALEHVGTQIVGLMWPDAAAEMVSGAVRQAVSESIRLGFLEKKEYDAWRPGMRSGSGWRVAVTATPYGVTRALVFAESTQGPDPDVARAGEVVTAEVEVNAQAGIDSPKVADHGVDASCRSNDVGSSENTQYRARLRALREARGLSAAGMTAEKGRDVGQVAERLADELDTWVEVIRNADADRQPEGGYWTTLAEDLENMLGPAELKIGVFVDDWTPLLTRLQMSGLSELAKTLDRLAGAVIPQAQELARDLDAVAYVRNGGPRDAFYHHYSTDDLATHEVWVRQGRQDVARGVMRIVGMLRTLAKGDAGTSIATAAMPDRKRAARPRRSTRASNIEKLERELEKHLIAARDHAHSLRERGREPALLPRPNQKELARRTGLSESDVSRCLNDRRAKVLMILWETADSLEAVMMYKRRC